MKKLISIIMSVLMVCLLAGCNVSVTSDTAKKFSIVATSFPQYDFAKQIAGDKAEVTLLLPPGAESHTYEPTPKDIVKIDNCDMFIYVGGESDEWINSILKSVDTQDKTIIKMIDCVTTVNEETVEGMENGEENPDEEGEEIDEHVWTSPVNAIKISDEITKKLCERDSENTAYYTTNFESYKADLTKLDEKFKNIVSDAKRKTIVFGDRFPFRYLADEYGLTYYAAFPGCSSETEPSAATLAFLTQKVKDENIPVVFHIEMSNESVADTICKETGAQSMLMHSCHNISKDDLANGATYLSLMNANADNLEIALN